MGVLWVVGVGVCATMFGLLVVASVKRLERHDEIWGVTSDDVDIMAQEFEVTALGLVQARVIQNVTFPPICPI